MLFIRKNFILHWKIDTGRINKVYERQVIFHGDLLGTQIFLGCHWKPGTGFYRGVIGNNHAAASLNRSNTGNHTG